MQQIYRRTPLPKCDFNKVALQFYWNHTSPWVFSCKFAAYFQSIFSKEHLWRVASIFMTLWVKKYFLLKCSFYLEFSCFVKNEYECNLIWWWWYDDYVLTALIVQNIYVTISKFVKCFKHHFSCLSHRKLEKREHIGAYQIFQFSVL